MNVLRWIRPANPEADALTLKPGDHPLRASDGTRRYGATGSQYARRVGEAIVRGRERADESCAVAVSGHRGRDVSVGRPFPGTHKAHGAKHLLGLDRHRSRLLQENMAAAVTVVEDRRQKSVDRATFYSTWNVRQDTQAIRLIERLSGMRVDVDLP